MNKTVYFGISILEIRKIVMYGLCYDYVKPKYGEKKSKIMLHVYRQFYSLHKKQNRFMQILQKMLKRDLILQFMNQKDHYLKVKNKK